MTSEFKTQIRSILEGPDSDGSIPVKRTSSDGKIKFYRCNWIIGYGATLTRAQYVFRFKQQPPEWVRMLHPEKEASINNIALKANLLLPAQVDF